MIALPNCFYPFFSDYLVGDEEVVGWIKLYLAAATMDKAALFVTIRSNDPLYLVIISRARESRNTSSLAFPIDITFLRSLMFSSKASESALCRTVSMSSASCYRKSLLDWEMMDCTKEYFPETPV